jgi:malonyl CoA-acyl carrier protein transacylase
VFGKTDNVLERMKMKKVPKFDTTMVDALSAAELDDTATSNQAEMKKEFQEAGFDCAVVPKIKTDNIERYADGYDIIAALENQILDIEEYVEGLESRKKVLKNELRWSIEVKAEDKSSGLTNENKRQIAYEQLALENEEFRRLSGELKIFRSQVKRLRIEQDNEQRAFQLKVWRTSQLLPTGGKA